MEDKMLASAGVGKMSLFPRKKRKDASQNEVGEALDQRSKRQKGRKRPGRLGVSTSKYQIEAKWNRTWRTCALPSCRFSNNKGKRQCEREMDRGCVTLGGDVTRLHHKSAFQSPDLTVNKGH